MNTNFIRSLLIGVFIAALVTFPFIIFRSKNTTSTIHFPAQDQSVGIKKTKCPFRPAAKHSVQCYRILTPQNYDAPKGKLISSFAVILEPINGVTKDDPFVYLEGGPGYASIPTDRDGYKKNSWLRNFYSDILESGRAVIMIDTRGLGFSQPSLQCPSANKIAWDQLKLKPAKRVWQKQVSELSDCFLKLRQSGVALEHFNTRNVAKDIALLRRELNIEQWNIYGVSYGAQTALNLLQVDQQAIRSVIFDSPSYDRIDVYRADQSAFDRIINKIDTLCADEPDEHSNCMPDVKARLTALLQKLQTHPIPLRTSPLSAPRYLGPREAITILHNYLYSHNGYLDVLLNIQEMESQGTSWFHSVSDWAMDWEDTLYWSYLDEAFSYPIHMTTICSEANQAPLPEASAWPLYSQDEIKADRATCEALNIHWDGRLLSGRNIGNIPALVLSGDFDVITPPEYGKKLAKDIHGIHFTHPNEAHGIAFWSNDYCVTELINQFLELDIENISEQCADGDIVNYADTVNSDS
ncbi:MAG: alpha/beta fold hydrolase [bacterium]